MSSTEASTGVASASSGLTKNYSEGHDAMTDLAYAFTLYFVTLGPLKTVAAFYVVSSGADRRTTTALAVRSAVVATTTCCSPPLSPAARWPHGASRPMRLRLPGGVVLLMSAIRALTSFH